MRNGIAFERGKGWFFDRGAEQSLVSGAQIALRQHGVGVHLAAERSLVLDWLIDTLEDFRIDLNPHQRERLRRLTAGKEDR